MNISEDYVEEPSEEANADESSVRNISPSLPKKKVQNQQEDVQDVVRETVNLLNHFVQNDPFASTIIGLVVLILLLGGVFFGFTISPKIQKSQNLSKCLSILLQTFTLCDRKYRNPTRTGLFMNIQFTQNASTQPLLAVYVNADNMKRCAFRVFLFKRTCSMGS